MILNNQQIILLREIVTTVSDRLYKDDLVIISKGGMERSVLFRFGLYLHEVLKQTEWAGLDLDIEYNKNVMAPKRIPRRKYGVQPDLILHKRDEPDNNILVIEFKGWWNANDRRDDLLKLEDFIHQEGEYKYGLGAFIELNLDKPEIEFFMDYQL